ncbi:MAG: phosphotransferase family protein [Acidimicrobiales bacterium]|nr:phosphotransferase family protein [Acidimicrobiales bacterium]
MDQYQIQVSSRDVDELRARFDEWIARRHPGARIESFERPDGNGLSSETLLFDASWDGELHPLVARVAPSASDVPVFETYDLGMQYRVMQLVAERSDTPVPECLWEEDDESVIGAPFFVMRRVDGRVPRDNLPYTFEGWLLEATDAERLAMQDDTVWAVAGIHGVDLADVDTRFLGHDPDGPPALCQHLDDQRRYYDWIRGDEKIPVIEDTFAWLEANWPADDGGQPVLSWGDSRIGNVIYDGFRPAAFLDWEMAGVAPRGVDLGWLSYMHIFFQDVAEQLGLDGLPGFLDMDDVATAYESRTGIDIGDRHFWLVYAALRYGLVMVRIEQRQIAFGEIEPTGDPETGVMHRDWLRGAIS